MFTDLAIILVNWNLKDDTQACIDSLLKAGASHSQIVVVDNGSTDDSFNFLRSRYESAIQIIQAGENLGYAAGVNLGINYALLQKYNWLLLLNNDTIVAEDFISEIHSSVKQVSDYSIISPVIFYHQNPSVIWSVGEKLIGHTLLTKSEYKNQVLPEDIPLFIPIDMANGCAMLVHRKVFERIGVFDSALFMYGEEVDFCWRAKLAGFASVCYTAAHLWHKISQSADKDRPFSRYLRIRNQIYFYRRYSKRSQKPLYWIFSLIRLARIICTDLLHRQIGLVKPAISGWRDGWFGKIG